MKKLLVEIDENKIQAVTELKNYGKVTKVSILLNIFKVEGKNIHPEIIRNIDGVLSIEEEFIGELMCC